MRSLILLFVPIALVQSAAFFERPQQQSFTINQSPTYTEADIKCFFDVASASANVCPYPNREINHEVDCKLQPFVDCLRPLLVAGCKRATSEYFCDAVLRLAGEYHCDVTCPMKTELLPLDLPAATDTTATDRSVTDEPTPKTPTNPGECMSKVLYLTLKTCPWPQKGPMSLAGLACDEFQPLVDCVYPLARDSCGPETTDAMFCKPVLRVADLQDCTGIVCPSQPQSTVSPSDDTTIDY